MSAPNVSSFWFFFFKKPFSKRLLKGMDGSTEEMRSESKIKKNLVLLEISNWEDMNVIPSCKSYQIAVRREKNNGCQCGKEGGSSGYRNNDARFLFHPSLIAYVFRGEKEEAELFFFCGRGVWCGGVLVYRGNDKSGNGYT